MDMAIDVMVLILAFRMGFELFLVALVCASMPLFGFCCYGFSSDSCFPESVIDLVISLKNLEFDVLFF